MRDLQHFSKLVPTSPQHMHLPFLSFAFTNARPPGFQRFAKNILTNLPCWSEGQHAVAVCYFSAVVARCLSLHGFRFFSRVRVGRRAKQSNLFLIQSYDPISACSIRDPTKRRLRVIENQSQRKKRSILTPPVLASSLNCVTPETRFKDFFRAFSHHVLKPPKDMDGYQRD